MKDLEGIRLMPSILQNPNAGIAPTSGPVGAGPLQNEAQQVPQQVPQQTGSQESTELTTEQQDQYDNIIMAGMKVLFEDEKMSSNIVSRMKADSKNPAKALSDTVSMLVIQLDKQSGDQIDEELILPVATELLEQTAELADSLKLFPIDDAVLNFAAQLMVKNLSENYGATPEDAQELMNSVSPEQLKQIEEEQGNYARKQPPQEIL